MSNDSKEKQDKDNLTAKKKEISIHIVFYNPGIDFICSVSWCVVLLSVGYGHIISDKRAIQYFNFRSGWSGDELH